MISTFGIMYQYQISLRVTNVCLLCDIAFLSLHMHGLGSTLITVEGEPNC